jgi:DNA-binding winged helix-turn-helix (wHTH) protein
LDTHTHPASPVRFGAFELDLGTGELRKNGTVTGLPPQPFKILAFLVSHAGELVTRDEIREHVWGQDTFVDFEHGLNFAIQKIRSVLRDDPDSPSYIETLPRRGYRFIAPVNELNGAPPTRANGNVVVTGAASDVVAPLLGVHKSSAPSSQLNVPLSVVATRAPSPSRAQFLFTKVAALVFVVILGVAGLWTYRGRNTSRADIKFKARDWVLITDFDNRTGEPVLNGTLEYALERELSNSRFVNVVPRERVEDALRLMRKPLDAKIDAAVGREICLRDGGVPAMLTGRVEKFGSTYTLSTQLVDPIHGVTLASLSEVDPADSQMAGAVHRLSDRVRQKLGEQLLLIQQSEANLEKVTTPSLKALQLYTNADRLIRENKQAAAAELLKQAIDEDPGFASAHILLGWALKNQEKPDKEYVPYAKRAFELSEQTSERERYFIQGSYHQILHQVKEAAASYEALLRLYPDHFWGASNLEDLYKVQLDQPQDRARLAVRLADLRPGDSAYNVQAAFLKLYVERDLNGARPYLERARTLVAEQGSSADPNEAAFVQLFPAYEHWLKGDIGKAHDELVQIDHSGQLDPGDVGLFYLTFGEIKEAERHFRAIPSGTEGFSLEEILAFTAFIRGDGSALKQHLQRTHEDPNPATYVSVLMVHAGMWSNVERGIQRMLPRKLNGIPEGELALARKQTARGISLLEEGVNLERGSSNLTLYLGFGDLAEAYRKQGKLDAALQVLEESSKQWSQSYFGPIGTGVRAPMWMNNQVRLADLYRRMGREQEAKKIEDELSNLLVYADSDYPIRRELEKRRHAQ